VIAGGERPECGHNRSSKGAGVGAESGQPGPAVARVVPRSHPQAPRRGHHQPGWTLFGARLHLAARRLRPQLQVQRAAPAFCYQQGKNLL
jgi:hypothetical protein